MKGTFYIGTGIKKPKDKKDCPIQKAVQPSEENNYA